MDSFSSVFYPGCRLRDLVRVLTFITFDLTPVCWLCIHHPLLLTTNSRSNIHCMLNFFKSSICFLFVFSVFIITQVVLSQYFSYTTSSFEKFSLFVFHCLFCLLKKVRSFRNFSFLKAIKWKNWTILFEQWLKRIWILYGIWVKPCFSVKTSTNQSFS